jgi:hypothetical protein
MLNHTIIRTIFVAAHTAVEYIPGEGAFCPVCFQILQKQVRGIVYSTEEDGVRRCRCNMCGISFKAVQKYFPPDPLVSGKPKSVDERPKKRQSKTRKR